MARPDGGYRILPLGEAVVGGVLVAVAVAERWVPFSQGPTEAVGSE